MCHDDNKPKLFEKIVYFASGVIGDEVCCIYLYIYQLNYFYIFTIIDVISSQKEQC